MKKVIFVTSTLKSSGPINQLYSLIRNLINDYRVTIISLSPEPIDTRVNDFVDLGVDCRNLGLSRFKGIFRARSALMQCIKEIHPDLVHSQGLRPDTLMSSISGDFKWCLTIHNFPKDDYRMKYGWVKGELMTYQHLKAIRKCNHAIACSKSIAKQFLAIGIKSNPIQNGVSIDRYYLDAKSMSREENTVRFIVVGSLIARKNPKLVIKAYLQLTSIINVPTCLTIVGDGPDLSELKQMANDSVEFLGQIKDVEKELFKSDIFISASYAEGLPYTVLEALCSGLPLILSSIDPHIEIADELDEGVFLFNDLEQEDELVEMMKAAMFSLPHINRGNLSKKGQLVFSDKVMADKYHNFYSVLSS